ncbi:MAG: type III pantothenate kinase [Nitrosomonadales bacterium]
MNKNTIFIDIGNSNIKIRIKKNKNLLFSDSFSVKDIALLKNFKGIDEISRVLISNVAHESHNNFIKSLFPLVSVNHFIIAQVQQELLKTDYAETLGIDRWLSALAIQEYHFDNNIIIDAGTTVTIDLLVNSGHEAVFKGGIILPGLNLYHQSLNQNTNRIASQIKADITGINTTDMAVMNGFLMSVTGAIEQLIRYTSLSIEKSTFHLTGGDQKVLFSSFREEVKSRCKLYENLVLDGLEAYANLSFLDK